MAECRALTNQAADAQCAAVEAELAAASAREEAGTTRSEAAELYDTWRVRTEAAEAAARDSYVAAQCATRVAKEAFLKLSEAMEKLTIAEDESREAKDIVTWQEQRIAELEGRSSEQTCREYGAELISLREQFAARQSDLESEVVSLKLRIRESEMPKAAPYQDKGVKLESCWALDDILVAEGQIAKESAQQIGDDRHSPDARAAFVELMATAVAQEKREGDRSCVALQKQHLQHVQVIVPSIKFEIPLYNKGNPCSIELLPGIFQLAFLVCIVSLKCRFCTLPLDSKSMYDMTHSMYPYIQHSQFTNNYGFSMVEVQVI